MSGMVWKIRNKHSHSRSAANQREKIDRLWRQWRTPQALCAVKCLSANEVLIESDKMAFRTWIWTSFDMSWDQDREEGILKPARTAKCHLSSKL